MQKRAAIYCRVSSKVQADGYSLETQEAKGMELATSKGWHVIQVLHEVHTGREYRQRPVLSELRELIRGRQIDIVIVIAFDRLAREMIHQAVLLDEMKHNQVELVSVTEEIDDSPLGQFMRQALGFVAAMEWEKRRERTERGMEGKVKHGFMLGFGIPLYGYQWADTGTYKNTHYVLHPEEWLVVRRIYDMYLDGGSMRGIAGILNKEEVLPPKGKGHKWRAGSIFRILNNRSYYGYAAAYRLKHVKVDGIERIVPHDGETPLPEGTIPAIITEEEFHVVQRLMKDNKQFSPRNNPDPEESLLRSGFVKCGYCGTYMVVRRHNKPAKWKVRSTGEIKTRMRPPDYKCSNSSRIEKPCSCNPTIEIRKLDSIVWEKVGEELNEHGYIIGALELLKGSIKQENDIEAIERSIAKCKEELEQLTKDLMGVRGYTRDLLLKQMQGIEESIEKLEAEKREALPGSEQTKEKEVAIDNFMGWLKRMKGCYNEATYEEKREALRMLGVTVYVYRRDDPEHERYEIYFSLRDIVSQQAPRWEIFLLTGGRHALS